VARNALKLEINITSRPNIADYPYLAILTIFMVFGGHLADFKAFGKMLTAPKRKRPASSALHRSKENNFLYRMTKMEV
jgi:hypothetical protein